MLIPKVKAKEFEKFGFKKCKGEYGKSDCYYLCVARGVKMLFVSNVIFDVNDWRDNDPRIHKDANCRYRDHRTYLDIIYELIKENMLRSDYAKADEIEQSSNIQMDNSKKRLKEEYNKAVDDLTANITERFSGMAMSSGLPTEGATWENAIRQVKQIAEKLKGAKQNEDFKQEEIQ